MLKLGDSPPYYQSQLSIIGYILIELHVHISEPCKVDGIIAKRKYFSKWLIK
jgi:hypothetical protein